MTIPALTVSVIIPVYNAEKYLEGAVNSVLPERANGLHEILLVEDASRDNSLAVCQRLQETHPDLVRIVRHPDGENRGAGASRNLGIANAISNLICFLDADDYWLPGRLFHAVHMLTEQPDLDGVYDEITLKFESEQDRERFDNTLLSRPPVPIDVAPDDLFYEHTYGRAGLWHTNGIVVRRSAFERCGVFNESLRLNQDFELWLRMAAVLRLAHSPTRDPVAIQRRHPGNRWFPGEGWTPEGVQRQALLWDGLYDWFWNHPVSERNRRAFFWSYCIWIGHHGRFARGWQVAWEQKKPWMILTVLRGYLPGPRTLWNWFISRFHSA